MVALGILVAPLALFGLFHKTRLHYIGIEYTTPEGKKAALLLQAHKNNFRAVLMALRGATRSPVSVSQEERKYVPAGIETPTATALTGANQAGAEPGWRSATVMLTSVPELAEIRVDETPAGNTPAELSLVPGKHKIQVSLGGCEDWVRDIDVRPSSEVSLNAVLEKR
jgi:hypothetical protein